jgi:hypothetical protein
MALYHNRLTRPPKNLTKKRSECIRVHTATLTDFSRLFGVTTDISTWPAEVQIRLFLRLACTKVALMQHEIFLNP